MKACPPNGLAHLYNSFKANNPEDRQSCLYEGSLKLSVSYGLFHDCNNIPCACMAPMPFLQLYLQAQGMLLQS